MKTHIEYFAGVLTIAYVEMTVAIPLTHQGCISGNNDAKVSFRTSKETCICLSQICLNVIVQESKNPCSNNRDKISFF